MEPPQPDRTADEPRPSCQHDRLLAFVAAGLAGFFAKDALVPGIAVFFGAGLVGSIVAAKLFDRLSTPEERQRDLEDRVRNSDI